MASLLNNRLPYGVRLCKHFESTPPTAGDEYTTADSNPTTQWAAVNTVWSPMAVPEHCALDELLRTRTSTFQGASPAYGEPLNSAYDMTTTLITVAIRRRNIMGVCIVNVHTYIEIRRKVLFCGPPRVWHIYTHTRVHLNPRNHDG